MIHYEVTFESTWALETYIDAQDYDPVWQHSGAAWAMSLSKWGSLSKHDGGNDSTTELCCIIEW
jgi:hypothetical protein